MKNSSSRFPPLSRIKELLSFDPDTGIFTWRVRRGGGVAAGSRAGTLDAKGYIRIRIDAADYRAHRLAWYYHYGVHPVEELDHVNRDKTDNRICNLRDADRTTNVLNRGTQKNNSTGRTGVNWRKDVGRWTASIACSGVQRHLGYFDTFEAAVKAREAAEKALGRADQGTA